jgi:hypothetical protein
MGKRAVFGIDAEEDEVPKAKNGRMKLNREEGLRSLPIQSKSSLDNSARCSSSLHSLRFPLTNKAMLDKNFTC